MMKDLKRLFGEVIWDAEQLNIPYGKIYPVINVSKRAKSQYGHCRYIKETGLYEITVSRFLLEDDVSDMALKDTLMHELIHTCPGCMNHGPRWKLYAEVVNRSGKGYAIKRVTAREEKGLAPAEKTDDSDYRYVFRCSGCGQIIKRKRASAFTKRTENYRCGRCGNRFFRIR